ncbi:MAG: RusA family crossover junction endodeoxyribonuclease [Planctomycetes bacterium]|nr:RusA family crossover junction endodeoxyribonuclease [Planctomycetota bacterium]
MILNLPYPPSINHYWRRVGPRTLISREGRTFRTNVCALLGGGGPRKPPAGGRIALCMDAFPPDRRRRDLDNIQKPVLDALEHAGVYEDDSLIDLLITRRRIALAPSGKLAVTVHRLPLRACPLCGRPLGDGEELA